MTNNERKQLILNALKEYSAAKQSGSAGDISRAINNMENTYICVNLQSVEGIETLRAAILEARNSKK